MTGDRFYMERCQSCGTWLPRYGKEPAMSIWRRIVRWWNMEEELAEFEQLRRIAETQRLAIDAHLQECRTRNAAAQNLIEENTRLHKENDTLRASLAKKLRKR